MRTVRRVNTNRNASGRPNKRRSSLTGVREQTQCRFCRRGIKYVDYKDIDTLGRLLTNRGKIIYAVALGLLTVLIRRFGSMPEGVCFSILFMNAIPPLIDRYTKTKPYGLVKKVAASAG